MKTIPITLITGFLGAGKSTLINRIIKERPNTRFGLIVNEFGDVQLESSILETTEEEIVELPNGCMCCVVRADIIGAVEKIISSANKVDCILVEASGLSDPMPIAQTFMQDDLAGQIRLDSILCVVDAENFGRSADDFSIAYTQLRSADILLLSKSTLVPKEQVQKLREVVKKVVPLTSFLIADKSLSLDLIIDTKGFDHSEIAELEIDDIKGEDDHEDLFEGVLQSIPMEGSQNSKPRIGVLPKKSGAHDHYHEHVETLFYKTEKRMDHQKLSKLIYSLPESIVRGKGFIAFSVSAPLDKKYLLQFVGSRRDLIARDWAPFEQRQTALVFIGKSFDKNWLELELEKCTVESVI